LGVEGVVWCVSVGVFVGHSRVLGENETAVALRRREINGGVAGD
jgi:hypothetical protein